MPLRFIMWNVQHGSAALIQTPNGKNIAIDLGASDDFSPLQALVTAGITELDHATITHPHMDHIDDILNLGKLSLGVLCTPRHLTEDDIKGNNPYPNEEAEAKIQKYLEIRQCYSNPLGPGKDIGLPQNVGDASIKTFAPCQSSKGNLNNHSIVTAIEYAGVKILVPGDNEAPSWVELLGQQDFVNTIKGTHVLVAAHHARESGFPRTPVRLFQPVDYSGL